MGTLLFDTAASLLPQLSEFSQRSMVLTQEKGAGLLLFLSPNTALLCTKVPFAMPLLLDMDGTLLTHLHIASVGNHSL